MPELKFMHTDVGYNKTPIVTDVSFEINKGEIAALIGPNGAGKSTILKTASGMLKPISGEVYIQDKEMSAYSLKELYGILSVMMTDRVKTGYMTCYDVVRVGRYQYTGLFGGLSDADRSVIRECMELIGVWEYKDRDFNKLSDGQKQRVLLSRSIVSEPDILILDEPASFLDMGRKIEFFDALITLVKKKKMAVLISMHEAELIKKVADRVICISADGKVGALGDPGDLITPGYMEELFGIPNGKYEEYFG
ncbi:MAG: ABC transporter ATP-binding protein [Lachnospiraceae bacterium]|nr:ABC transporter ATP-binding protein [Lachnospiraceae bacterium]